MSAVADLTNATRLRFDLALHYVIEIDDDIGLDLSEKDRTTNGVCIAKPAGRLEFTLNTQHLKIGSLLTNFDILLVGQDIGQNRVRWDARLPNGSVPVKTKFGDATITSVSGSITTELGSLSPPLSNDTCPGASAEMVSLTTLGSDNRLKANASASLDVRITVTNIKLAGAAGIAEDFVVKIHQYPFSDCYAGAVENTTAWFRADVTGVPPSAPVSYAWNVTGGSIVGSNNGTNLKVAMPPAPGPVLVELVVSVTFQNRVADLLASRSVSVAPFDVVQRMEFICKILMKTPRNLFVDPLWDPLRGIAVRPMTAAQTRIFKETATAIRRLAGALSRGRQSGGE